MFNHLDSKCLRVCEHSGFPKLYIDIKIEDLYQGHIQREVVQRRQGVLSLHPHR